MGYHLLQPFHLATGLVTKEELEELYKQLLEEMLSETFRGLDLCVTTWGYKAEASLTSA